MSAFFNTLRPTLSRPPVWFLRQVGRYMPQYQELKGSQSLKAFFHNTEAIIEATLLGPSLLHVDAAILFADILSILDGFSINYDFAPGPQVHFVYGQSLNFTPDPQETFRYLLEAIGKIALQLTIPLIVFAASPFTLASYLFDGGASKDFTNTMAFLYHYPEQFQILLNQIIEGTAIYLKAQIQAGASAVQLFDSSSFRLPSSLFSRYITNPNKQLITKLKNSQIPVSLFCRCCEANFMDLYATQADTLHPDYHVNLAHLWKTQSKLPSLQGNLDPAIFLLPQEKMLDYVKQFLAPLQKIPKFIFNSGHGILPQTPLENVQAAVAYVQYRL
ncbi:uroporphyrinogen decarboxylase [Candidatus Chlamydia sanziniae]|uniref:Uroporphyrinogen decarboxylase n=1 Tax=Candidatus Chlamydia sanziniae TaxID=1806891 RepID=A0A1A9HUL9_9CHLA|nr:uroporphyrinogen decarboxylase [Candidatus Chlamydia sanziniae]ANH78688.1 Uroporphyrinogen III decarboxylase [Candidatus Chlamydia sanziniae]